MNQGVKTNLAKLLATENLVVEHKSVETASFDVKNRVLTLPVWNVSDVVYDMLVGHEVGHALFTPEECRAPNIPASFINVVEDARIERKIKSTYPGITKSFSAGYKELNQRDFFDIQGKDLMEEFELIDRINIYFKLGIHDVTCVVPFLKEEEPLVEKVRVASTFEEVLEAAKEIHEFMKSNKEQQPIPPVPPSEDINPGPVDTIESDDDEEEETEDNTFETPNESNGNEDADLETPSFQEGAVEEDLEDDFSVKTQESFSSHQSEITSNEKWEYVTPPTIDWENHITYNDEFIEDFQEFESKIRKQNPEFGGKMIDSWFDQLKQFNKDSAKAVSFLVKEFEMKESAKEYNRSFMSKTGVLDTNKIYSYKWNEDLFKKSNVIPSGKNHGLLMFIDWSGSMSSNIESTIKQLFNLVQFCAKVNIPFEVYSFVENNADHDYKGQKGKPNEISVGSGYRLIQLFTSEKGSAKLEVQLKNCWLLVSFLMRHYFGYGQTVDHMKKYEMGSTPLNETIFAAVYLYKKFRKKNPVEKVNTVFLTDGESNQLSCNKDRTNDLTGENYVVRRAVARMYDTFISFQDPKSGYQQHKLWDPTKAHRGGWGSASVDVTSKLLQYYRWMTNCNVIGYRLSSEIPGTLLRASELSYEEYKKQWRKHSYVVEKNLGYSELYAVKVNRDFRGETQEMDANSNSTQSKLRNEFRKHVKGKSFNKIILSKFVDQIA